MAHKLNFNNGRYSFASAKEIAWHGLGTVVEEAMTSEEAIKLANLDYEVALGETFVKVHEEGFKTDHRLITENKGLETHNSLQPMPGKYGTYRTDTFQWLKGVVGNRYAVVQNQTAFDFFDNIVGSKEAIFETAGCLGNGEVVFITAKLPDYINVGKDDRMDKYLVFYLTHDGSGSIKIFFTPIRVVCNNTLRYAINRCKNAITIRHSISADSKIRNAAKVMGISNTYFEEVNEVFNNFTKIKCTDTQFVKLLAMSYLDSDELLKVGGGAKIKDIVSTRKFNTITSIREYRDSGPGQDTDDAKGTLWGAYNAVTGFYQNVKNYGTSARKLNNVLEGSFNGRMDTFTELLTDFENVDSRFAATIKN